MRRGEEEEECELKLELSIGGIYGKSENHKQIEQNIVREPPVEQSNLVDKTGFKFVDLQKRKEIHRDMNIGEEGRKRLRWVSNVEEDKVFLESQEFQNRGIQERDWFCEGSAKKSTFSEVDKDLNHCLYRGGKSLDVEDCGNSGSLRNWNSSKDCDLRVGNAQSFSNGAIECSSSAASNRRSTSPKVSGEGDTGSHSSGLSSLQNQSAPTKPDAFKYHEGIGSSSSTEPDHRVPIDGHLYTTVVTSSLPQHSNRLMMNIKPKAHSDETNNMCSIYEKPAPNDGLVERPQQLSKANENMPSKVDSDLSRMPYVSTTGNGPNGRTVNGFLYRCSKSEISIMCVCHGKFFSPAEFVEHAGGIDIQHPLRCITMVR